MTVLKPEKIGKHEAFLSPSNAHAYIMDRMKPSMSYAGGDVKAWQRKLRKNLAKLTGYDVMPRQRIDLAPRTLWRKKHALGTIEKIIFSSEPGSDVPAYVCIPDRAKTPYDFVICVQGHSSGMHNSIAVERNNHRKSIKVEGDRDFGIKCMEYGYAALCIEQRAFGDREERLIKSPKRCHHVSMQALMLGRTLIGERVWDIDRGIDYLKSRSDVNMDTIGCMGNSGGGTATTFAAALLPRLGAAMPSCSFSTFRQSIMSMYHCQCNYIPGLYPVADMGDILGLFAPRPLVVVSGDKDPIFPVSGARSEFRRLKKIYRAADAPGNCRHVIGKGGHRFYAAQAWPAMKKLMKKS